MRTLSGILCSAAIFCIASCHPLSNPVDLRDRYDSFRPGHVWEDTDGVPINAHHGGVLYKDGTYYWFGTHMGTGDAGNTAEVGVMCYSSRDLYNWKNEGVALAVSDDPAHELAAGCRIERAKVIYNSATDKYVMWFHLELKGQGYTAARSGVAASNNVAGPYAYLDSFRPNGSEARDMTLFVDDDGKAYHFYAAADSVYGENGGQNATMHVSLLTDDYLRPSGKYARILIGKYLEAPAVFEHEGKYWLIGSGCTGWTPNAAHLAVADSIWGPWAELGNPCTGPGSQLTFNSQGTFILPVAGKEDAFIFMADRWKQRNPIEATYVWLPIQFENGKPTLRWLNEWDVSFFEND